ncbi:Rubisco methyltransferase family protein isoform 2 [Theobroma cacao]|uniref:Rubisco methyltransferase family protein isoform 2 n=1 Tax=Theobroma cacao TaxID=3641 RepID=A0A061E7W1_THECC|nr:Rubisco methyltransferase family protein isoform 2 [Theobroma cacao]
MRKYLGVPLIQGRKSAHMYRYLEDKDMFEFAALASLDYKNISPGKTKGFLPSSGFFSFRPFYTKAAAKADRLSLLLAVSSLPLENMAASKMLIPSLTKFRPLTCAAAAFYPTRLVPHPPDLVKWVKREGGFVHEAVKIAQDTTLGLGLVASGEIPKGSDLIVLPDHVPLKFQSDEQNGADSVLLHLSHQVPDLNLSDSGVALWVFLNWVTDHSKSLSLYERAQLLCLSSNRVLNWTLWEHVTEELWAMKLGLKLLQERAKVGSFWWPYISNLPETYSVPIFFTGEDIKNLQYAPLLYQVNKRCRFLLEFEQEVKNALKDLKLSEHPFGGQDVDASSLGWAMSAVSSRAFRLYGKKLPDGSRSDIPMMLPLIDMCNHSFNPNAQIVQEQDVGNSKMLIKVVAEKDIKQNDPLLLHYGCLSNDFFLLDYGFVMPSNPYDYIELKYDGALMDAASMAAGVSSPNFSAPAPWQRQVLSQLKLDGEASNLKVIIGGPELVEGRLLSALRVILSNDMELVQRYDLNVLKSLSAEAPLGFANEVAVFRTIIALCVIALGHFPTKIMDDESQMKQGVPVSTELAIQFRIQKKSVIIDVMRDLTKRVKLLSSKETTTA